MFDLTISLGTVLQTITIVGSAAYFIWSIKTRLEVMDTKQVTMVEKISKIEIELDRLTDVVIVQAKQDQRINNLEERLQELSNRIFSHVENVLETNRKIKKPIIK